VNVIVTVIDTNSDEIENARVLLLAKDGTGPMSFEDIVTITRSGSIATVAHTGHGMATDDKIQVLGANQIEYNSVFAIAKINSDSYNYTVTGTPDTPATGTIKVTYAALSGETDINGEITMSRVFSVDQPVTGRVRKSTGTPFYKTSAISGIIDKDTGLSINVQMLPDE